MASAERRRTLGASSAGSRLLQQAPALLRQRDDVLAGARQASGLDQPLFAKMSQIARARIRWPLIAIPVPNQLPLQAARESEVTREYVTGVEIALASLTVAFRPPRVIMATAGLLVRVRTPRIVAGSATERSRIVILIPMAEVGLSPVVIVVVRVSAVARFMALMDSRPLLVTRVTVASVEVKHVPSL